MTDQTYTDKGKDFEDSAVNDISLEGVRLLVAEDDEINQMLLQRFSDKKKIVCEMVSNGEEALEKYKNQEFDLVMMDIQMPVMDGYATIQKLRNYEKIKGVRTPVIAITAHALTGDKEKCIEAGMDDYLSKPISIHDFYQKILYWVNNNKQK